MVDETERQKQTPLQIRVRCMRNGALCLIGAPIALWATVYWMTSLGALPSGSSALDTANFVTQAALSTCLGFASIGLLVFGLIEIVDGARQAQREIDAQAAVAKPPA